MAIIRGSTEIKSYQIRLMINREDNSVEYTIWLNVGGTPVSGDLEDGVLIGAKEANIFFIPGQRGGSRSTSTRNILLNVSDRDAFYAMYRLVQTEKPAFFHWGVDTGVNNKVIDFQIATDAEPVGEFERG